jgi:chromosome partitioning protein
MTQVTALATEKGGAGKTTLVVAVAGVLAAERQLRTLIVDLDPRHTATSSLALTPDKTMGQWLLDPDDEDAVLPKPVPTAVDGLDVLPGHPAFATVEKHLANEPDRHVRLRQLLDTLDAEVEPYDQVLVDTPGGLGVSLIMALGAAETVVVPTMLSRGDVEAVASSLRFVTRSRDAGTSTAQVRLLVPCRTDSTTVLSRTVVEAVEERFGIPVAPQVASRVAHAEATWEGVPVTVHEPRSKAAEEARAVADRLLEVQP